MTKEEFLEKYKPTCDGCVFAWEGDLDIAAGMYEKVTSCSRMAKEVEGDFCLVPGTGCRLYTPAPDAQKKGRKHGNP